MFFLGSGRPSRKAATTWRSFIAPSSICGPIGANGLASVELSFLPSKLLKHLVSIEFGNVQTRCLDFATWARKSFGRRLLRIIRTVDVYTVDGPATRAEHPGSPGPSLFVPSHLPCFASFPMCLHTLHRHDPCAGQIIGGSHVQRAIQTVLLWLTVSWRSRISEARP